MFPLFAQLVAPPIQPGPARLPERQSPTANDDAVQLELENEAGEQNEGEFNLQINRQSIEIEGSSPYNRKRTQEILRDCELSVDSSRKNSCVNQLNAQLQKDGYINTRVVAEELNGQTKLIIIPGRLVAVSYTHLTLPTMS